MTWPEKGPFCTVPDAGEQSSAADGNQALPEVQIAREVCGHEADPRSNQEFKSRIGVNIWISEVSACSSATPEILSIK